MNPPTRAPKSTICGGGGNNDFLLSGYGDHVDGGSGDDFLYLNLQGATSGVVADFRELALNGSLTIGSGTITGIEYLVYLTGSGFDDFLVSLPPPVGGNVPGGYVYGAGGNDHIISYYAGGELYGGDGDDLIDATQGAPERLSGGAGNDRLLGGYDDDDANGGAGNDHIEGNAGIDFLDGGDGDDTIYGGADGDRIKGDAGVDQLFGNEGSDEIRGGDGNDIIYGDSAGSSPPGPGGNDTIWGDAGADTIYGGDGDDVLYSATDILNTANDVDTGAEADKLFGGDGNDIFYAGYGDSIDGGAGTDRLANLNLLGAAGGVSVEIGIGAFTIGGGTISNIETISTVSGSAFDDNIRITAPTAGIVLEGNEGNDRLTVLSAAGTTATLVGGAGDDVLAGGAGDDVLNGGDGNDSATYASAAAGVTVDLGFFLPQNTIGAGTDRLINVENVYGSGQADILTGSGGANILSGGGGDDQLFGKDGNDQLIGGTGSDVSDGGLGDDWHFVDSAADRVIERAGEGRDIVYTTVSYALAAGVHVEALSTAQQAGTASINLIGNELANLIVGNDGTNVLRGGDGGDTLAGLSGNDQLIGDAGVDVTDGGLGDDWHFVDNAADRVIERAGEGRDIVYASVSYVLENGVYVEALSAAQQSGVETINLSGNDFANLVVGNNGANILRGRGGDDTLIGLSGNDQLIGDVGVDVTDGGLGDDWHFVDNLGDVVVERAGEGRDIVYANASYALAEGTEVEALSAASQAGTETINLRGNEYGNLIVGNAGSNIMSGGSGADILVGLGGADGFLFDATLGNGNVDTVSDFTAGTDRIYLDQSVFTGLGSGQLAASAFATGSAAADADDRILYDQVTGALYFDADGTGAGAAVQFATLGTGLAISAVDFTVF